ncbi:MAG TPA: hypothetical protein PKX38_07080 [Alphaproteobacteria bacterium]|jgi:hypothetical protein|nr:hypothetical protein [Micavibrio sp.]HQX27683.1 hypothetical protein [Alphaproteobacteria bacterium]
MGKTLQIKKLEGVIYGLERELEQLAPRPDHTFPRSISRRFNSNSTLCNMPRRLGLERRLAVYRRLMTALRDSAEAPALAA